MASAVCFSCVTSIVSSPSKPQNPRLLIRPLKPSVVHVPSSRFECLKAKAAENDKKTKTKSIVCEDCEGNGAILCTQCKGGGVNLVDHFNGQFKAGALCWLCRGKRDILCGSCNGAGFLGGFMSTFDE